MHLVISLLLSALSCARTLYALSANNSDTDILMIFSAQPAPAVVRVNPELVRMVKQKAALYRPSRDLQGVEPFEDGPPSSNMTAIAKYWANHYDWYSVESGINAEFPHYTTTLSANGQYPNSIPLHFIHQKSSEEGALPILLLHGWPSTHLLWSAVFEGLVSPSNGTGQRSFHVVAVDLPGFGFSPAPTSKGLGPQEMGHAFNELMQQLGYSRYIIYSTDLGYYVARWMVHDFSANLMLHISDFYLVPPNSTDLMRYASNTTTVEESDFISSAEFFSTQDAGYMMEHSTRPLQVSLGMTDSPVGWLGWIWQVAQLDGYGFTMPELITTTMMLFIGGTYGNTRAYKEIFNVSCPPRCRSRIREGRFCHVKCN